MYLLSLNSKVSFRFLQFKQSIIPPALLPVGAQVPGAVATFPLRPLGKERLLGSEPILLVLLGSEPDLLVLIGFTTTAFMRLILTIGLDHG
jgi:hypothetical protein